jgi:hypothetical protein
VLPLLPARGGVSDAHLRDGHLGHVDQGVHPDLPGDHHLGTGGPQGRRPVVLAADQGADREPALEEQASHGSPDRPELTGRPGDEDRPVMLGAHDDSPGEVAAV